MPFGTSSAGNRKTPGKKTHIDIRNEKKFLHTKIKHFTLKATASTILILNAESAMATPCPSEIFSNALASVVCNFITNSSVTVENGGTVGSIQMASYQPVNSHITVNAGGQVSNTTGIGIAVTSSSSLSNGLSNNGTISAASGIGITANSVINGGLSNSGLISTVNAGINVSTSIVSNGLSNSGTISSSLGAGVSISNGSTLDGGISNRGEISSHTTGITIVGNSIINGGIFNSGTIDSHAATGIRIASSTVSGGITNSGTISGSGVDSGISIIANSVITGDITNQSLISAINGNAIHFGQSVIQGGILNNGRIDSTSDNGINVSNVTTIQGNITNNGTLSGGQHGISILSGSTVGGIVNAGTITAGNIGLNISSSTINGSITNSGTISGGTTGINIAFTSTVNGGISNSGTIQGDIFAIHISSTTVSDIDILGKTARIIGAVDAVNTDVNITNGALFSSEGSYTVRTFNVADNSVFNMANSITVANGFNNSGTVAMTEGLQTITGDYTQNSGGIFQTNVSDVSHYGQLTVTGEVDLSQSGNIYVHLGQNSSLHNGDVLSSVINGNTFTSPTSGFNVTDNSAIWKFTAALNNTNNGINLTASINPSAYNTCQGAYCQGALNTIIGQVAEGNSQFGPYATLPTSSALQTAASQATPELTNENTQMIPVMTQAVVDIVPMWSSLHGKSAGDEMLTEPGKMWIKPYGLSMTQNKQNTVNGFNARGYGAVIGRDIELDNHWMFGGAFAAGIENIDGKSVLNGQSIDSKVYQGMLYGAKRFPNQLYFAGQALIGYENNDTSRSIPLYMSTAKGSYNSWFTNARVELGWNTYSLNQKLVLTPQIDASYLFINQGGYRESQSPMSLLVDSNNNSFLILGASGHGAYHLTTLQNQYDLTLTGYAGIAGNVLNSQPQTTATFLAGGPSFTTAGIQVNSLVFRGGIGLACANKTKPLSLKFNYDLQSGNSAYSGVGSATIIYEF